MSCTLSGRRYAIMRLKRNIQYLADGSGIFIDIDVNCAYHSKYVEDAAENFATAISFSKNCPPKIEIFSSVTGKRVTNDLISTHSYWKDNVQMPVRFSRAIVESVSNAKSVIFLEIGPKPVLKAHIKDIFPESTHIIALPSMKKDGEIITISEAVCNMYEHGIDFKWASFLPKQPGIADTPKYRFWRRQNLYLNPDTILKNQGIKHEKSCNYMQEVPLETEGRKYKISIDVETLPYLYSHVVNNGVLLPGAFYANVGFFIAEDVFKVAPDKLCLSLEFLKPVHLNDSKQTVLTAYLNSKGDLSVKFLVKDGISSMCKGFVTKSMKEIVVKRKVNIEILKVNLFNKKCSEIAAHDFYEKLDKMGFRYGPSFQMVKLVLASDADCLADIEVPENVMSEYSQVIVHPCIVDAIFQTSAGISDTDISKTFENQVTLLPVGVEEIRVFQPISRNMIVCTRRTNKTLLENMIQFHFDFSVYSKKGELIMYIRNFTTHGRVGKTLTPSELLYNMTWSPVQHENAITMKQSPIVVLTNISESQILEVLKKYDNVKVFNWDTKFDERMVSVFNKITKETAIVFLAASLQQFFDINEDQSNLIYEKIMQYNMFLTECFRVIHCNNMTNAFYIVTQNALLSDVDDGHICMVTATLWGFIRSVLMEFLIKNIVLIDVQPDLLSSMETFLSLLSDGQTYKTYAEILIKDNKVYHPIFSRALKTLHVPPLRETPISAQDANLQEMVLFSSRTDKVQNPFFSQMDTLKKKCSDESNSSMHIRPNRVFLHPPYIYQVTDQCNQISCILTDSNNNGSIVIGVEYTGYLEISPMTEQTANGFQYDKDGKRFPEQQRGDSDKEGVEHVVILPAGIKAKMCIPLKCAVSIEEFAFYYPGILVYTIYFMEMINHAHFGSVFDIQTDSHSSGFRWILEGLLRQKKQGRLLDRTQNDKADVLFLIKGFESIDKSLCEARIIVTFKNVIPNSVKSELHGEVVEIGFEQIFDIHFIPKNIRKAVEWLNISGDLKHEFESNVAKYKTAQDKKGPYDNTLLVLGRSNKILQPCLRRSSNLFRKSGTYIVTGGLTGLGWELVKHLSEHGAGRVISFSRNKPSALKENEMRSIQESTNCEIISVQADVSDYSSVSTAFKGLETNFEALEIRGIFHGAGVLDSCLVNKLTEKNLDQVLKPKVKGCLNLHMASKKYELDYFLLQSSITSLIGDPGQSNYGAANAFLDAFAIWRRKRGIVGQSVNWGALNLGMAVQNKFSENFEKRGYGLLTVQEIRSCFHAELLRNTSGSVYSKLDWNLIARHYSNVSLSRSKLKMGDVIDESITRKPDLGNDATKFEIRELRGEKNEVQKADVERLVLQVAKHVFQSDVVAHNLHTNLASLGFDSMSVIMFSNVIYNYSSCTVPQTYLQNPETTLLQISEYIQENLFHA